MKKSLLKSSLALIRQDVEVNLNTYGVIIYGDILLISSYKFIKHSDTQA